ncbi:MAG: hypothetical protein ACOYMM_02445 [Phycisphaerales bacterium]
MIVEPALYSIAVTLPAGPLRIGAAAVSIDGKLAISVKLFAFDAKPNGFTHDAVVGEEVVVDHDGILAVVVAVGTAVVPAEEEPAARGHEADDRLLLGEREQDVRLGDHVDAVVREVLRVGRVAEGDARADGKRLHREAALDQCHAPRRERARPVGLRRARGDARLRRGREALRVRLGARAHDHESAGAGADVVGVGVDHPVGVAGHLRLGGVEEHLVRRHALRERGGVDDGDGDERGGEIRGREACDRDVSDRGVSDRMVTSHGDP